MSAMIAAPTIKSEPAAIKSESDMDTSSFNGGANGNAYSAESQHQGSNQGKVKFRWCGQLVRFLMAVCLIR